ncbi:MAG: TraB/GumN family protein [Lewinellaceae bacterium]|nr:TraB/GumN family protein [Lewinellaceae bacterium]
MFKHLFWLAPALFLANSTFAQHQTAGVAEQNIPTEKTLLWKISGNGVSKPSYLYGTIHLIPKEELTFSDPMLKALDKSKKITFEIDMKDMTSLKTQFSLMTKAFMRDGKSLRDLLSAEDFSFVEGKLEEKGMNIPMFLKLKPMFLSMMLSNEDEGAAPSNAKMTSVEMELYKITKKKKIASDGLETAAYQMSVFDSIPYQDQADMLVTTLRSTDTGDDGFDKMMEMYRDQDINGMQSIVSEEGQNMSKFEDRLLNDRNRNWIPIMGDMMRAQPTFFAVGAGHLGGPKGVIMLLRQAGYKVEAVENK